MRFIPSEFLSLVLSLSLFHLLFCSADECVREQAKRTCMQPRYVRIYIYIYICWFVSLFLSLFFSAHFCPATAARAMDNVILIYIYASDRPQFSIQTMHGAGDIMRHFGIASQIFLLAHVYSIR